MQLPAILDIEASGFGRGSYPIEIGFVTGAGDTFCSLIRPLSDWTHWDENAEQVHGVTRPILAEHGKPALDVCQCINQQLHGQTVYSDAWAHDYSWLGRLFDAVDSFPAFHLKDLRELLDPIEMSLWHDTRTTVESRLKLRRHRASSDARIIQETLREVRLRKAALAVNG